MLSKEVTRLLNSNCNLDEYPFVVERDSPIVVKEPNDVWRAVDEQSVWLAENFGPSGGEWSTISQSETQTRNQTIIYTTKWFLVFKTEQSASHYKLRWG